jgi:hypothetical protein
MFFVLVIGCKRSASPWKGTIEVVDKVTIIRNPLSPLYSGDALSVEEELSIGEAKGNQQDLFGYISMIAVDSNENIYVADLKEAHIQVYDKDGGYLRTIGRRGQGPGEFNNVNALEVTPQNELMVSDRMASKLIFFSLTGDYLCTTILKGVQAGYVHKTARGTYYFSTPDFRGRYEDKTLENAMEVNEYSVDLNFIKNVAKDKYWNVLLPLQPAMITQLCSDDRIICGFREDYEIRAYDSEGELVRRIFKDYEPVEIKDKDKEIRSWTEEKDLPRHFLPYEDLSVDDEGRLFVQLYEKPEGGRGYLFDVFDAEGKYVAKAVFGAIPQCWKGGKFYTIEEDDDGYQYVKRYKVTWNI